MYKLIGFLATTWLLLLGHQQVTWADDQSTNDELGKSAAELVRLRGFLAEDHYVATKDGYIINVVRILNPLIRGGKGGAVNKSVVLAVHGILSSASLFVLNSVDARPRDYSQLDAGSMSYEELVLLLGKDPTTNCFALTLVNFGHEVWLMNRRGTIASLGTTSDKMKPFKDDSFMATYTNRSNLFFKPSNGLLGNALNGAAAFRDGARFLVDLERNVNPRYWNFSADEQSDFDLPDTINYILKFTGRPKLSMLTHSLGGTIQLQALIKTGPSLNEKIDKSVFWAPSFYQGDAVRLSPIIGAASYASQPFLVGYIGPIPPPVSVRLIQGVAAMFCQTDFAQDALCEPVSDILFGPSKGQTPIRPGYFNTVLDSESSHQLAQVAQTVTGNRTRFFDYLNPIHNHRMYGQPRPPFYDLSNVSLKGMSFWAGISDVLVPAVNTFQLANDIPVPIERHLIGDSNVFFNHISFFFHENCSILVTIPSLKTMESRDA